MKFFSVLLFFVVFANINDSVDINEKPQHADIRIYKFSIKNNIDPAMWRKMKRALVEAEKKGVDFFLIEMNTYGGYLVNADSIRSALLSTHIPTIVFINNNAASAGALIALACDSIFMHPSASMGAATVVNQKGEKMPDKYQSYMRATMRSTAEAHGKDTVLIDGVVQTKWKRNPKIAEAMVDESIEIEGIIEKDAVLTFTANEAMENGYCEALKNNIDEIIKGLVGEEQYVLEEYQPTTLDKIIGFMMNPMLQGILIMIIIGGIYFELQTPGIGFPILASLIAAILYFSPLYLEGLATHWEIALFVLGLILVGLEIFVIPGFGIAGISGIICMVLGLSLSLFDIIDFNFEGFEIIRKRAIKAFLLVIISTIIGLLLPILLGKKIITSKSFGHISLDAEIKSEEGFVGVETDTMTNLIGKTGTVISDLRPSGTVEIDDEYYDAKSIIGFISKGKKITVIRHEASQIYVEKITKNNEDI